MHTGLTVVVHNDLVAHSLAESHFGAGRLIERFLSVSLGTGIGHTFILNGVPQLSMGGVSGESGRMILDKTSSYCDSMGVYGTVEAMCGVNAIEALAKEKYLVGKIYSAHDVISAANTGADPIAIDIMSEIARRLAILLVNLSSIYFPQVISLTGGQTEAGDFFIDLCRSEYSKLSLGFFNNFLALSGANEDIRIVKSETGGLTGLLGSIAPFLERIS
jgi:glucokinase